MIKSWGNDGTFYYYQDRLGSTAHIANASGALLESYRYDLSGAPSYFNSTSQPLTSSSYNVADLYVGERWVSELELYDLRNRFMSSELGRFLQPDPIGFKGDPSNLYRYGGNDSVNKSDPMGLDAVDNNDGTFSYTLQRDLRMESLIGWTVERFVGKANATALQCAGAAQVLAETRQRDGLHEVPRTTSWRRGPDVVKSAPAKGTLIAKGWDKEGRYYNTSNLKGGYKGNHAGLFVGYGKDNKTVRVLDQFINSKTGKPEALRIREYPSSGWSRVNGDRASTEDASRQILRPPGPPNPLSQDEWPDGVPSGSASTSGPPNQRTLPL